LTFGKKKGLLNFYQERFISLSFSFSFFGGRRGDYGEFHFFFLTCSFCSLTPPFLFSLFFSLIRETYEWNEEHIPYAYYTGRGCLERDIESLVPDTTDEIILYCAGGNRSLIAAHNLKEMGYTNVKSLKGGIGEWKRSGKMVNRSSTTYGDVHKS